MSSVYHLYVFGGVISKVPIFLRKYCKSSFSRSMKWWGCRTLPLFYCHASAIESMLSFFSDFFYSFKSIIYLYILYAWLMAPVGFLCVAGWSCLAHDAPGAPLDPLQWVLLKSGFIGNYQDSLWVVSGHLAIAGNCRLVTKGGTSNLDLHNTTPTSWPLNHRLPRHHCQRWQGQVPTHTPSGLMQQRHKMRPRHIK